MVTRQFDWLTLSCLTEREDYTVDKLLTEVLVCLHIEDLFPMFTCVGRGRFYAAVYRYNDISVKVPSEARFTKQGICVEFSGNGLAFYQDFLKQRGIELRSIFKAWRAMSVGGIFTRVTRVDYAVDDVTKIDGTPLLTLRKIRNCVKNHEFRSRLSMRNDIDEPTYVEPTRSFKNDILVGDTIRFGHRRSVVSCKFYDKKLEQQKKHLSIPDDVISWVRCEFEFHNSRAMAVFNAFCDYSDTEFASHMSKVFNNYICFINSDDINHSRCSVKRWWSEFLGTAEKQSLTIPKFKPSTFSGVATWVDKIAPTLVNFIRCVGPRAFMSILKKHLNDEPSVRHKQLQEDFFLFCSQELRDRRETNNPVSHNHRYDYVKRCGLDPWIYTSTQSETSLLLTLQKEYKRYHTVNGLSWESFNVKEKSFSQLRYDDYPPELLTAVDDGDDLEFYSDFYEVSHATV